MMTMTMTMITITIVMMVMVMVMMIITTIGLFFLYFAGADISCHNTNCHNTNHSTTNNNSVSRLQITPQACDHSFASDAEVASAVCMPVL